MGLGKVDQVLQLADVPVDWLCLSEGVLVTRHIVLLVDVFRQLGAFSECQLQHLLIRLELGSQSLDFGISNLIDLAFHQLILELFNLLIEQNALDDPIGQHALPVLNLESASFAIASPRSPESRLFDVTE